MPSGLAGFATSGCSGLVGTEGEGRLPGHRLLPGGSVQHSSEGWPVGGGQRALRPRPGVFWGIPLQWAGAGASSSQLTALSTHWLTRWASEQPGTSPRLGGRDRRFVRAGLLPPARAAVPTPGARPFWVVLALRGAARLRFRAARSPWARSTS